MTSMAPCASIFGHKLFPVQVAKAYQYLEQCIYTTERSYALPAANYTPSKAATKYLKSLRDDRRRQI